MKNPIFPLSSIVVLVEKAKNFKELNSITPSYQADGLKIGERVVIIDSMECEDIEGKKQFVSIKPENSNEIFDCYPSWCFELACN